MHLGLTWGNLGDSKQQKDLTTRVLQIYKKQYGEDHIQTGAALANLESSWGGLGNHEKQIDLLMKALTISILSAWI